MPMIDIYAAAGTFGDTKKLAADAAALVKSVEKVPDIPMFRKNTAAFVHEMPASAISNVDGDSNYVRVRVLTNAGAGPLERVNVHRHVGTAVVELSSTGRRRDHRPAFRGRVATP